MKVARLKTAGNRICKVCKDKFQPKFSTMQVVCGKVSCAIEWAGTPAAKEHKVKACRAETKALREDQRATDRRYWVKKLDTQFNKFIRLRDREDGCISCDTKEGQMHAGHYLPKGSNGNLRWDESNCHKQCATCNNHLSGNLIQYRVRLIKKIGLELVELLEGPHEMAKTPQIPVIQGMIKVYTAKVKELEFDQ